MKKKESELIKSTVHRFADVGEYQVGIIKEQHILRKTAGELNLVSIDTDQIFDTGTLPFDIYIHVIEGKLEARINGGSLFLNTGEFVIGPAHAKHTSLALQPTKILQLIIRSDSEATL